MLKENRDCYTKYTRVHTNVSGLSQRNQQQ